jgi:uncharacterized Tic20 family protein
MDTKDLLGDESTPATPPTSDEKTMGILAHILAVVAGFVGPLIIYLVKKDESAYVREHAKESLNFQLTVLIVCIILAITIIGILLIWVVGILNVVLIIIATIKASEGKMYKYPFSFKLVK